MPAMIILDEKKLAQKSAAINRFAAQDGQRQKSSKSESQNAG
ncbi:MAG: hypothetical protein WKF71_11500 [Pyrinomonadaceae bacterium]